jgi:transposase
MEGLSQKLVRLLKDALRLYERKDRLEKTDYDRLKMRLYNRLVQFLKAEHTIKDGKRLIKRLKRHKNELFTFLEYENVSPYNNHAEQQMRKPVLTRKISQQNRSEQGSKTQAILMTLFRSAELQGKNPVETVLSLAKTIIEKEDFTGYELKLAA